MITENKKMITFLKVCISDAIYSKLCKTKMCLIAFGRSKSLWKIVNKQLTYLWFLFELSSASGLTD